MGIIIAKFRKKKSTYDVLNDIDKQIKDIEEYRRSTEQSHKRIVGRFIVISVGIYLVTAFLFYFHYFPATFRDQLFYIIPLILAPIILLTVKRVLTWYYNWKIARKQGKLTYLRDEKKEILEKVMDTETYKVAKKILERFAPELVSRKPFNSVEGDMPKTSGINNVLIPQTPMMSGFRQRMLTQTPIAKTLDRPSTTQLSPSLTVANVERHLETSRRQLPSIGAPVIAPRNILARDRSLVDRLVDYLVGDGPSNRYALICQNCFSHNGMIFPEEFEYTSFRCCYCFTFNPARKKRPLAPKLELSPRFPKNRTSSETSESEKNSPSDTESEKDVGLLKSHNDVDVQEEIPEQVNLKETVELLQHEDVAIKAIKFNEAEHDVEENKNPTEAVEDVFLEEMSNNSKED